MFHGSVKHSNQFVTRRQQLKRKQCFVAKAQRSPSALAKAQTKNDPDGQPLHSYRSLLAELATQTRNTIRLPATNATFDKLAEPTANQAHALKLVKHATLTT